MHHETNVYPKIDNPEKKSLFENISNPDSIPAVKQAHKKPAKPVVVEEKANPVVEEKAKPVVEEKAKPVVVEEKAKPVVEEN